MEADDACGFKSAAVVRDGLKHLVERHLVVIGGGVLQQEQTHILHDGL